METLMLPNGLLVQRPTGYDPPERMLEYATLCTMLLQLAEMDPHAPGRGEWAETLQMAGDAHLAKWGA